jgi:hypothetical protein
MSASNPDQSADWQRACVKAMLARSARTDPADAKRLAAAASMVAKFRAMDPALAAAELLVHPAVRPGIKAVGARAAA